GGTAPMRPLAPASQEAQLKGAYYAGHWRLPEAVAAFEAAIAADSANAAAHAGLARAHYFLAFFGEKAPAESFSRMRRAAEAALRHDPRSAEAHGLLAYVDMYDWDWKGAEEHFREALALAPANAQVHHDRAHFLLALGRQEESKLETARALALDPANPMLTSCVGWHSLFDDSFEQAAEYARESQRMMPGFWGQVVLGWSFVGRGQHDSAVAALRTARELSKDLPFVRAALAHALARSGKSAEARTLLKGLLAESLRDYVSAYDIAVVYAGLGENAKAIEWLRKAIGERSVFVVHLAWDARLDPLRGDPAFGALVAELGIPPGHRQQVTRDAA
ncbi:MAG TPA: tetratricopeptide repeat protein, partial [Gemmatimonadales bacterium]